MKKSSRRVAPTRRGVLRAGGMIAAATLAPHAGRAAVGPVMARLSGYMSAARERPLPADVAEKIKHHVLDTLAAMISGTELAPGRAAHTFARAYGGEKVATVVGANFLTGPIEAALANGMLAHADETDDSHAPSLSHPGCAVVPASLAVGETPGIDDMLSGPDNFLLAHGAEADAARLVEEVGERYEVMRTNIKKWSVGSPIQAPLDALELLFQQRPFATDEVQKVTVRLGTRSASVVDNRDIPDICLQHMAAVMLIDRTVSFRTAHDVARMGDAAVQRQRAKVELVPDEELERRA